MVLIWERRSRVWVFGETVGSKSFLTNSGQKTTPSCVSFTATERYVGQPAKDLIHQNPQNTIYDIKRLIGHKYRDPAIQNDRATWSFQIEEHTASGRPLILANFRNEDHYFYPEEITAMILEKLKTCAEDFLGQNIKRAVIAVPAYFSDAQRQATADSARIAGLDCVRIINEPTAAALAYGLDKQIKKEEKVIIYDLGGGTLDVSLLAIENGTFEVIATCGDPHLGGEDFDNRIVDYLCQSQGLSSTGIRDDLKAMRHLKTLAEKTQMCPINRRSSYD